MEGIKRHFSKVMVAGIVALLPIGGTVLGILWLEFELREAIEGWIDDPANPGRCLLRVRVAAPPIGGSANQAMVRLIAKQLGIAPSKVRISSGQNARIKTVEIADIGRDALTRLS